MGGDEVVSFLSRPTGQSLEERVSGDAAGRD
jgi:hypothetical protein